MLVKLQKSDQRGDTIVEIMIVLAILGFAIAISYATAVRSLGGLRGASESATATSIAATQLELLRGLTSDYENPAKNIFRTTDFCIDTTTNLVVPAKRPECEDNLMFEGAQQFDVTISYSATSAQQDTFRILVESDNAQGHGRDSVTMLYRAHR